MYLMLARRARSAGLLDEGSEVNTERSEFNSKRSEVTHEKSGVTTERSQIYTEETEAHSTNTWCGVLSRQLITVALKSADSEVSDSEY